MNGPTRHAVPLVAPFAVVAWQAHKATNSISLLSMQSSTLSLPLRLARPQRCRTPPTLHATIHQLQYMGPAAPKPSIPRFTDPNFPKPSTPRFTDPPQRTCFHTMIHQLHSRWPLRSRVRPTSLEANQCVSGTISGVSSVAYPNMMPWSPAPTSSNRLEPMPCTLWGGHSTRWMHGICKRGSVGCGRAGTCLVMLQRIEHKASQAATAVALAAQHHVTRPSL